MKDTTVEAQEIKIPDILLSWSDWTKWDEIINDARNNDGVNIPNGKPGIYEVRFNDHDERLHIGRTSDLRMRVRQGLVKGKVPHSSGIKIRDNEDTSKIVVRWAETDRPAAVEEELHRLYKLKFSCMPKYTKVT